MGDGLILEKGKHNELLKDENGAYARLVAAQKLRDTRDLEPKEIEDDITEGDEEEDIEKAAEEEIPLGRRNTQQSLASAILHERQQQRAAMGEKSYPVSHLFMRMARINKDEWMKYVYGCIFAASTWFPFSPRVSGGLGLLMCYVQ